MHREIKFRVWCKNKNEWEIDYCVLTSEGVLLHRVRSLWVPLDRNTHIVQFYTGLKVKNDKEIYEGDIIEFVWEEDSCWGNEGTYKGFVQYDDGGYKVVYINRQEYTPTKDGGMHPNSKSDDLQSFIRWTSKINIKVIGNIYENPELLEVENE